MIVSLAALGAQHISPSRSLYEFDSGDPRRLNHLSLEQQKKRAKELLRALRAKDPDALARLRRIQPGSRTHAAAESSLSDAQRVIAREYGFSQWAAFKAHIEQTRIAREAVAQGKPAALDAGCRTLHIRCGNDIMRALVEAGFTGDFLVFADPYVQGPVPQTESLEAFIQRRAAYIAETFPVPAALQRLTEEYAALEQARDYQCVTLWFEHDSYDQLILARLLDYFSDPARRPARLRFVSVTHFPGVKRFNGLGHLPPEALRVLWQQFADVTEAQFALGRRVWAAITAPTPLALAELAATGTPALPAMAGALGRHLQELPTLENGLSLTEQLTLRILAEKGAMNAARLFGWYANHYEPLPFLGDSGYWRVISGLADVPHPALTLEKRGEKPKDWPVEIQPLGRRLLEGGADWLELNAVHRWVGGVEVDSRQPEVWRFDQAHGVVMAKAMGH